MNDFELWTSFREAKLPHAEWSHHAHLRIAWMFLRRHELDEAHILMRAGIVLLNASHGLVETAIRGYHETMTRTWLALVARAMRTTPSIDDSQQFIDAHRETLGKDAPMRHYSRELLFSAEARARYVEPDLAPVDRD
jgi:hypothetical protein